jgi:hypothetical protein
MFVYYLRHILNIINTNNTNMLITFIFILKDIYTYNNTYISINHISVKTHQDKMAFIIDFFDVLQLIVCLQISFMSFIINTPIYYSLELFINCLTN